ncbi:hypothetical protein LWI28_023465 [Acer negundo]|uniref:RNase H type-1 domain-containing protein n=1 Tax=Acer negundo TaxID=4023 RepID=A0AAD5NS66_ACENE|nr:hypothetical protein LWI28_023465 [Acer negundo]
MQIGQLPFSYLGVPLFRGGLGLKDLGLLNDSLLQKFTWKFIISNGFAFSFLQKRYLRNLQKPHGGAFVKGCFAIPLGQVFAYKVELLAASLAINVAWKYVWHRIWLESDSFYMVRLLSSCSEMVPWKVHQAWQRCIFQISQMDFQVSHIFREGNQVVDTLSKHVLEL